VRSVLRLCSRFPPPTIDIEARLDNAGRLQQPCAQLVRRTIICRPGKIGEFPAGRPTLSRVSFDDLRPLGLFRTLRASPQEPARREHNRHRINHIPCFKKISPGASKPGIGARSIRNWVRFALFLCAFASLRENGLRRFWGVTHRLPHGRGSYARTPNAQAHQAGKKRSESFRPDDQLCQV
jgi:hypothetical protein